MVYLLFHYFYVSLLFVSNAIETLDLMKDEKLRKYFKRKYLILGVFMVLSPILAWLFTVIIEAMSSYTFFAEMFGIWVFAAYWWTKSKEIAITNAEQLALKGELDCQHNPRIAKNNNNN